MIEAMGYGRWKVRFDDGSVEELNSRMLKKIRFIGESDCDDNGNDNVTNGVVDNGHDNDSYDYNWDSNDIGNTGVDDDSQDSAGLELEPTGVDDPSKPDDEFNKFIWRRRCAGRHSSRC